MLRHYIINEIGKAVMVQTHPRKTKHGMTMVREFERIEPIQVRNIRASDTNEVIDTLEQTLMKIVPHRPDLIDRTVRHYFGNFLVPIVIKRERLERGEIEKQEWEELIKQKQKEFVDLFGKVKEAIEMGRIGQYTQTQPFYEIRQSRRLSYGII